MLDTLVVQFKDENNDFHDFDGIEHYFELNFVYALEKITSKDTIRTGMRS